MDKKLSKSCLTSVGAVFGGQRAASVRPVIGGTGAEFQWTLGLQKIVSWSLISFTIFIQYARSGRVNDRPGHIYVSFHELLNGK